MSDEDSPKGDVKLPVEQPHMRALASFKKEFPFALSLFVFVIGISLSALATEYNAIWPVAVVVDIAVVVLTGVTFVRRATVSSHLTTVTTVTSTAEGHADGRAKAEAETKTSCESTGFADCPECGNTGVEEKTNCSQCGEFVDPYSE